MLIIALKKRKHCTQLVLLKRLVAFCQEQPRPPLILGSFEEHSQRMLHTRCEKGCQHSYATIFP